jgi:hypothetical protein
MFKERLDLDRLHKYHFEADTVKKKRNYGHSTYAQFQLIGFLQILENSTIFVKLPCRGIRHWAMGLCDWWFMMYDEELRARISGREMTFKNNTNKVIFIRESDENKGWGYEAQRGYDRTIPVIVDNSYYDMAMAFNGI